MNMRCSLWRCANCQMRSAAREESLGAEIVNRYLADMKLDLMKTRGARKFLDVAKEGEPRFEKSEDEEVAEMLNPQADDATGDAVLPAEPDPDDAAPSSRRPREGNNQTPSPARHRRRTDGTPVAAPSSSDSSSSSSGASPEPQSEPRQAAASAPLTPLPPNAFRAWNRPDSVNNSRETGVSQPTSRRDGAPMPFPAPSQPYPGGYYTEEANQMPMTYFLDMSFQNQPDQPDIAAWVFTAKESEQSFFIKKAKRPGDEIDIRTLPPELQKH